MGPSKTGGVAPTRRSWAASPTTASWPRSSSGSGRSARSNSLVRRSSAPSGARPLRQALLRSVRRSFLSWRRGRTVPTGPDIHPKYSDRNAHRQRFASTIRAMPGRISVKRVLLILVGVLALAIVVLNWTYGRLPAEPKPTGSFIQVGKLRIHYIEHPGAGTPVVLIHGLPGTAEDWEDVTPLLAGHRTIAIDPPGFGSSTGGYVPFDRQLEVIHELLAKLHVSRPILVGHSYGGTISLGFAERYPSTVRGLGRVDAAAT